MSYYTEISFSSPHVTAEQWQNLLRRLSDFHQPLESWRIYITIDHPKIRYFLATPYRIPANFAGLSEFFFCPSERPKLPDGKYQKALSVYARPGWNFTDFQTYLAERKHRALFGAKIKFIKLSCRHLTNTISLYSRPQNLDCTSSSTASDIISVQNLAFASPSEFLAVDFAASRQFSYQKMYKYLDCSKALPYLGTDPTGAILAVDPFPYGSEPLYLHPNDFDFAKHSVVFGASGSGKSKFMSLLLHSIYQEPALRQQYKIVVLDPHAALESEIGALAHVVDFDTTSINLFDNFSQNTIVSVELLLDVFRGLLTNYNSKLERVLRHSFYLLLTTRQFNFQTLRRLIVDLDYRTKLVKAHAANLPEHVVRFFLTDFNALSTHSYSEAIAPLITLLDELELLPALQEESPYTFHKVIDSNFLTIFSLNRSLLGDRIVKTISGLAMQQLFTLASSHAFSEKLIFVVDEVAVVENPILCRFLAESRKFGVALILAGQYYSAVSPALREAIFANVSNYYLFRLARDDAHLLSSKVDIKVPLDDTVERKAKILSTSPDRTCIARVAAQDTLLPAFTATTPAFTGFPRVRSVVYQTSHQAEPVTVTTIEFDAHSSHALGELLARSSSARHSAKELQNQGELL